VSPGEGEGGLVGAPCHDGPHLRQKEAEKERD